MTNHLARTQSSRTEAALYILICLGAIAGLCCLNNVRCYPATIGSANFILTCADDAETIRHTRGLASACERLRRELAVKWIGREFPDWSQPARITIRMADTLGAGGTTMWAFDRGQAFGWTGTWQGPAGDLYCNVLPHEITHMVLASHFREPVPRWADEGAATSVEQVAVHRKWQLMLVQLLKTGRGMSFNELMTAGTDTSYGRDPVALYAHGVSHSKYLIEKGGERHFVAFVEAGPGGWSEAASTYYGADDLGDLQDHWLAWVKQGEPLTREVASAPMTYDPTDRAIPSETTGST